jgi:histidyl-tRNA synthetase
MSFDLSLARGLDYYTGIIYEAITAESAPPGKTPSALSAETAKSNTGSSGTPPPGTVVNGESNEDEDAKVGVGSIAAGGRYDNLVGMFSPSGTQVPCVGISFGVERLFSILWKRQLAQMGKDNVKSKEVDVFVMAVGDALLVERMQIAKELWDGGLRVGPALVYSGCLLLTSSSMLRLSSCTRQNQKLPSSSRLLTVTEYHSLSSSDPASSQKARYA